MNEWTKIHHKNLCSHKIIFWLMSCGWPCHGYIKGRRQFFTGEMNSNVSSCYPLFFCNQISSIFYHTVWQISFSQKVQFTKRYLSHCRLENQMNFSSSWFNLVNRFNKIFRQVYRPILQSTNSRPNSFKILLMPNH